MQSGILVLQNKKNRIQIGMCLCVIIFGNKGNDEHQIKWFNLFFDQLRTNSVLDEPG